MKTPAMIVWLLLSSIAFSQDASLPEGLVFPLNPVKPVPSPTEPTPSIVDSMEIATLWVATSTSEYVVISSPEGFVSIASCPGPATAGGRFADGVVPFEMRQYSQPFVYMVAGIKPGKTELILIPKGFNDRAEIIRQPLTVTGNSPNPPPDPKPFPEPDPKPEPVKAENVRLVVVEDTLNRSADTAIVLSGLVAWTSFLDDGNEYRLYDVTSGESKGIEAKRDAGSTEMPVLLLYDKKTGKLIKKQSLPTSFEELEEIVKETTNG